MAEAAEETTYDAAPAAPPPSWNILVAGLAAPEGFDLAPLVAEVGGGSRARISAVDAEARWSARELVADGAATFARTAAEGASALRSGAWGLGTGIASLLGGAEPPPPPPVPPDRGGLPAPPI